MPRFFDSREARLGFAFVLPAAIFLAIFVLYPVFEAIRISFTSLSLLDDREVFVGLSNYREALSSIHLGRIFANTAAWTLFSLLGQFALGLAGALCINSDLPGMRLVRTVLLLPYVIPVITLALFARWMLDGSYGIIAIALQQAQLLAPDQSPLASTTGAMVSVVIANIWRGFPFVMISYWAALQAIPHEQYESAAVDGASTWQQFRYVTLPFLADVTKVLIILRFIWTITYFDIIWLITRGGPAGATEHWPIWIYQEAMGSFRHGYGSALAVLLGLLILLVIAAYLALLKIFGRSEAA